MEREEAAKKSSLVDKLEEKLRGAKFRILNELMCRREGKDTNAALFEKYHEGFREQTKKWPSNPVNKIISEVKRMDRSLKIVDLGCGDALLERRLKKMDISSYDLVKPFPSSPVIVCDIRRLPVEKEQVDVAVFCLSLMSEDASEFIKEAHRILKPGGLLKIAEVRTRIRQIDDFVAPMKGHGFKLLRKDLESNFFCFFDFKKSGKCLKSPPALRLKPCVYKKR